MTIIILRIEDIIFAHTTCSRHSTADSFVRCNQRYSALAADLAEPSVCDHTLYSRHTSSVRRILRSHLLSLKFNLSLCAIQRPLCRAGARAIHLFQKRATASESRSWETSSFLISVPQRQYWWSGQSNDGDKIGDTKDLDLEKPSPLVLYRRAQSRTSNVPRRIYILGAGSIGGFVAHSLAGLPQPPPITLLLSNRSSLKSWYDQGGLLRLSTKGLLDSRSEIDVEYARRPVPAEEPQAVDAEPDALAGSPSEQKKDIIHNLIVSVKAFNTVDALRRVAHRLTPQSSILFIQNGMGIIEEVNEAVFPDPANRPQYMLGVISHGVYETRRFHLVHGGHGTTALAILPGTSATSSRNSSLRRCTF